MTIKELRLQKEMTQQQLADAIGVNVSVISKYESGTVTPPTKRLEAIAYTLEVEPGQLLNFDIEPSNRDKQVQHLKAYATYLHNPYLKRMVLLGANGHCELCQQEAPFKDKEGRPYLIVHVIERDYTGNEPEKNLVALCPNCNAKLTMLGNPEDISALKEIASHHIY